MNHQHTMDCLDQLYQLLTSMQGQINLLVDVLHSCPRHELSISSDSMHWWCCRSNWKPCRALPAASFRRRLG